MKSIVMCFSTGATILASSATLADMGLAKSNGCLNCHTPDKKLVGPAYRDIAKRYAGKKGSEVALFNRIRKGATVQELSWKAVTGGIPMPPNASVPDNDLRALIKWILAGAM